MKKTLRNKHRGNTRKLKGSGFFNGFFGSVNKQVSALSTVPTAKARMGAYTNANGPLAPGAGFTRTTVNLGPGMGYTSTTNAYGHTQAGLSGVVPGVIGMSAVAQRLANPPEEGLLGLKGNATEFSKYPNPYKNLNVSFKATNAEIKAAYNNKISKANNSQKKLINAAYATLSDPAKKAKYNADAKVFFATHKPEPGDLMAMYKTGTPQQQQLTKSWAAMGL